MFTICLIIGAIVAIVLGTVKLKIHPFLSLFTVALLVGLIAGFGANETITMISQGFGNTLSSIGTIIAFGTIIGVILERTNSVEVIVHLLLKWSGGKATALVMNFTGFIVSIPVFCDSAYIILSSINKTLSKKTFIPLGVLSVALATGLYAAHVFVPPTPGPLAASSLIEADLGLVLIYGLIIGFVVSVTGYFSAKHLLFKKVMAPDVAGMKPRKEKLDIRKSAILVFLPIIIPIVLIAFKSIVNYPTYPLGQGVLYEFFNAIGNPIVALFTGVVLAFMLTVPRYTSKQFQWTVDALKDAGLIILITGAGGAFGHILKQLDIANLIAIDSGSPLGGLILIFLIASILKTSQGSSTVAIITTAALVAPLLSNFQLDDRVGKTFAVLAIGAGAMTVSHVNDSYFWVVSQFSGMSTKQALKTYSIATFLQGIIGIGILTTLFLVLNMSM
ncbi:MAG: GntP family permease [Flavobacteriaceae bacterium]|nr:GntP family permease [Flavobacteriaceae bacterium]